MMLPSCKGQATGEVEAATQAETVLQGNIRSPRHDTKALEPYNA